MRAASLVAIALCVAACRSLIGFEEPVVQLAPDDAPTAPDDLLIDTPPDGPPDAPANATCEPTACTAAGGTCTNNVCVIVQTSPAKAECPSNMSCHVRCLAGDDCKQGVNCRNATSCLVECAGAASCQSGQVECGSASVCTVRCTGSSSCQSNPSVKCQSSTCDVTCDGGATCSGGIDVDQTGTCEAHCCGGGCAGGTDTCTVDSICTN